MKQASSAFFALFLLVFLGSSCNDPTLIGSDLLEQDQVNVGTTDTITLRTHTVLGDSVRTYSPFVSQQLATYIAGNLDDPILGVSKASIYAQLLLEQTKPDLTNATFDSLVLVLPIDTTAVYGDHSEPYGFEVYRVTEDMNNDLSYYSDQSFMTEMTPIGSVERVVMPYESNGIFNANVDSVINYPHLTIRIDDMDLINTLMTDTLIYASDSTFLDFFKGIHVLPTTTNPGILAFNLFDTKSGLKLYYTQDDEKEMFQYRFLDESVKVVTYEHLYDGTPVKAFIEEESLGDSLTFVQAMAGIETIIEIPYTDGYDDVIINKATIEFFIADLPEDGDFPAIEQLLLSYLGEDGEQAIINDISFAQSNFSTLFGGTVVAGKNGEPDKYILNISNYFQDLISGQVPNELYITTFLKTQRASRSILYGAGHSTYPAKLNITFTQL